MEILINPDSEYEWLKNIPSGNCFKNKGDCYIYMKTQSTKKHPQDKDALLYGCVDLSDGKIYYELDKKVIPVHATVIIGHNSNTLKEEGAIDD